MRDGAIYAAISDKLQLKEIAAKDAEIERLSKRLKQCEASLSTWDDHCDSRYWTEYPDAREAMEVLNQQSTQEPK